MKPHYSYEGTHAGNSMITKLKFIDNQLIRTKDCFCESILLKNEQVCSFLDLEFKQMIVTCEPFTLLLFINWKCMRIYSNLDAGLNTFLRSG